MGIYALVCDVEESRSKLLKLRRVVEKTIMLSGRYVGTLVGCRIDAVSVVVDAVSV